MIPSSNGIVLYCCLFYTAKEPLVIMIQQPIPRPILYLLLFPQGCSLQIFFCIRNIFLENFFGTSIFDHCFLIVLYVVLFLFSLSFFANATLIPVSSEYLHQEFYFSKIRHILSDRDLMCCNSAHILCSERSIDQLFSIL